jgi:hypothetical protein
VGQLELLMLSSSTKTAADLEHVRPF